MTKINIETIKNEKSLKITSPEDLVKLNEINKEFNINKIFLKDTRDEEDFLKKLREKDKTILEGLATEIKLMKKVYEEQLERLCRLRFDIEIFNILEKIDMAWNSNRKQAEKGYHEGKLTVEVIREQLIKKIKNKT